MKESTVHLIGTIGVGVVIFVPLLLPAPYSSWLNFFFLPWISAYIAFSAACGERGQSREKMILEGLKLCFIFSLFGMLVYGQPTLDPDGFPLDDGFPTTGQSAIVAGVIMFAKMAVGAYIGFLVAGIYRGQPEERDVVVPASAEHSPEKHNNLPVADDGNLPASLKGGVEGNHTEAPLWPDKLTDAELAHLAEIDYKSKKS